ncbi:hypothetical protein FOVSG1_004990 [Fusarium oxysporum f. sp. vasinfectum]
MSIPSGVQIHDECITAVNELRSRRDANKPRYVIYKISDNGQSVVVDETSSDKNYEAFLNKLASATDDKGEFSIPNQENSASANLVRNFNCLYLLGSFGYINQVSNGLRKY